MHRPKNKTEGAFFDAATTKGWIVSKKGWPDFFCLHPDGSVMVVETKPNKHRLAPWQNIIMTILSQNGIPCFIASDEGVIKFDAKSDNFKT
jgi:hypothetical protein